MSATTQSTPNKQQPSLIREGMRVPFFEPGSLRTPLSAKEINPLVAIANAFSNLKITRVNAQPNSDGSFTKSASFSMTDQGAEITLVDSPGTGEGFANEPQSFTADCPVGTSGTSVTVTIGAERLFSATSVADANNMAAELAQFEAESSLVCGSDAGSGAIDMMALTSDGSVVIIGNFQFIGGWSRPDIALLNQDLSLSPAAWKPLIITGGDNRMFNSVCVDEDDFIYLVGNNLGFATAFDCLSWTQLSQATVDGGIQGGYGLTVKTFQPKAFGPGTKIPRCLFFDVVSGRVIIGGSFTTYNAATTNELVAIDNTGATDGSFSAPSMANRIGIIADGGTGYYTWGGTGSTGEFVRLDSGGTADGVFQPWTFTGVHKLLGVPSKFGAALQGSALIVSGTAVGALGADSLYNYGVVRLNGTTGEVDSTFYTSTQNHNSMFDSVAKVFVAVQPATDKIVCGGTFTNFGGVAVHNLMRLNSDGSPDWSWTCGANDYIQQVLIEPAGTILVCGNFTLIGDATGSPYTANMVPRYGIARLTSEGVVL